MYMHISHIIQFTPQASTRIAPTPFFCLVLVYLLYHTTHTTKAEPRAHE